MPFTPMPLHLETARLTLQPFTQADGAWWRQLVVERNGQMPSADEAREVMGVQEDSAAKTGIALLTVRRRAEGDCIGYCGLIIGRSTIEEPEIAYELFRGAHGFGYATEAATAIVEAAIATGRRRLWSTVRAWNTPSFRVLEKLGFSRHHSTDDERGELVWLVRELTAPKP
ncbi:GNAT family N-acetyltransferase [Devosia nitrariae]|uniref:N-acetyltransferase n=1 Tax=Devosia nitrariae TaxID=2071872 RepID=A0ABQ5WBS6_9HYPH|nr:GNAT family N-acetyltransferase [Devosia nitrariae]GLQ57244.1 N-acetyltransferase [Devosia nitrariae]